MSKDAVDYAFVNPSLNAEARELRQDIPMRAAPGALDEYIRCWSEDDVIDGRPCKALVVILKTRGCTWALAGGCTMCGYANESAWQKVSADQLVAQFERAWRKYDGEELVKIYTSGSFVDRHEVMPEAQQRIMQIIGTRAVWDQEPFSDEAASSAATDHATSSPGSASDDSASSSALAATASTSDKPGAGSAGRGGAAALRVDEDPSATLAIGQDAVPGVGGGQRGAGTGDASDATGTLRSAQDHDSVQDHDSAQDHDAVATGHVIALPGRSGPGVRKVAFESLPGFIQDDTFTALEGLVPKLEVGIGVESANDRVLTDSINKGHGFATFPRAAAICREHGVSVKAYLMCKPPFLTEADALEDATQTIIAAAPHSDVVSLNPTNVQGRTVVDALYKRGSYRAPWLWTLVHAVLEGDKVARAAGFTGILKSDVIAAGQDRGAHNCGQCDERVVKYLKKYKDTQDRTWLEQCLEKVQCPCRKEWQLTLELGRLVPAYANL